jgi:rhodanese-related sulfurtransferase
MVMARFFEFAANHWQLVSLFVALCGLFFWMEHRRRGGSISCQQAVDLINKQEGVVLDVRDSGEYKAGHIVNALHIPHAKVAEQIAQLDKYRARPIIVVCGMGQQAGTVCETLKKSGFEQVHRLGGGMGSWQGEKLPVVRK